MLFNPDRYIREHPYCRFVIVPVAFDIYSFQLKWLEIEHGAALRRYFERHHDEAIGICLADRRWTTRGADVILKT